MDILLFYFVQARRLFKNSFSKIIKPILLQSTISTYMMVKQLFLAFRKHIFFIFFIFFIFYYNVDNSLSDEDVKYIKLLVGNDLSPLLPQQSFNDELCIIVRIQDSVISKIKHSKGKEGIPFREPREPKNVYEYGEGFCYDRTRVIEKALIYIGFKTRHISIFRNPSHINCIRNLFSKSTESHALTEVLTQKGWLAVDSNERWISIDKQYNVLSYKDLQDNLTSNMPIKWLYPLSKYYHSNKCAIVYGLYSRHGKFYPPYDFVPDYNLKELLYNIMCF